MADKIRGLTVEISADATQLKKELSAVRKDAKSSQAELSALQKSLELKFDGEKLARAQKLAQDAIDKTAAAADMLRQRMQYLEKTGNADTSAYRQIQAELAQTELKTQQLQQELEKLNTLKFTNLSKQFTNVGNGITNVGKALTPLSTAAAGAVTGLGALGLKAVSTADEVATLATQYDMSAEALQKFNYVALQTDTSAEDLYKAFVKVRAGVADIASGTTSIASSALKSLNLDFNAFDGSEAQFYAIVDALANMTDKTQMVAVANDIFGDKLANNVLPLIYAGTDAINAYCNEYDELGAMTDEQVASLAEFDNVLNKIKTQLSNVVAQIGAALLPIMQVIADMLSNKIIPKLQTLAEWFNSLSLGQQDLGLKALLLVAALAPVITIIGKLTTGVGSIIKLIPKLMSGLSTLAAHPIILVIVAIVGLLILLYMKCESFREAVNNLIGTIGEALEPMLNAIMSLLQSLMSSITPIIDILGAILATVINLVITALQPFIEMLTTIFSLIAPLINIALLPLQLALNALSIPLQMLGTLLGWLAPLFTVFANIVRGAFTVVLNIINHVLGVVESAINWCIEKINILIDGVNSALGGLGVSIARISNVSLKIDTSALEKLPDATIDTTTPNTTSTDITTSPDLIYDTIDTSGITGDVYNYDNSTNTTTQNVTVTIQNYAEDVDVDNLVRQINLKLAEAM